MIELRELEESQVSVESVRGWCVQEQAMEMDIAVLQQVEELERKVTAASLQVKVKLLSPPLHILKVVSETYFNMWSGVIRGLMSSPRAGPFRTLNRSEKTWCITSTSPPPNQRLGLPMQETRTPRSTRKSGGRRAG